MGRDCAVGVEKQKREEKGGRSGGRERRNKERDRLGASEREQRRRFCLFRLSLFFLSLSLCFSPESLLTDVPDPAGDKDARHGWRELGERKAEEGRNGNAEERRRDMETNF